MHAKIIRYRYIIIIMNKINTVIQASNELTRPSDSLHFSTTSNHFHHPPHWYVEGVVVEMNGTAPLLVSANVKISLICE